MKIDQATLSRLMEIVTAATDTDEVEARYTSALPYEKFDTLVRYFRSHGKNFSEQDTIDVSIQLDGKSYRVTATGEADVAAVMAAVSNRTAIDPAHRSRLTCITKSMAESVTLSKFDMKVTRKHEVPVTMRSTLTQIAERFGSNTRVIRTKRRFTCGSEDGMCRFDLTAVNHMSMLSNTEHKTEIRYEAEVELLRHTGDAKPYAMSLLKAFSILLKIINGTDYVLSADERQAILTRYSALTKASGKFIGPKPVTLELRHLAEPSPGSDSVRGSYVLTDKADGERALAYIDAAGALFLIDDRMGVRATGVTSDLVETLFDCEVVKHKSAPNKLIVCFDVYFYKGKDVRRLPLALGIETDAEDRISYLTRAMAEGSFQKSKPTDDDIMAKEFRLVQYGGEDVFNQVRYMVRKKNAGNIPYETDGFIFTPSKLAVGAQDASSGPATTFGMWDKVFKWKPPEFNSIDFLLRFPEGGNIIIRRDASGEDVFYRPANLFVGTRASANPISLLDYVKFLYKGGGDVGKSGNKTEQYIPRLFEARNTNTLHMCLLPVSEGGLCRCDNGDVINDNSIVEMSYTCSRLEGHTPGCWRALRVRHDKNERYRLTGSISGTANDINTALSVWRSICFPITLEVLTGATKLDDADLKAAVDAASRGLYYMRDQPREQSPSIPMLTFHNHWVKRESLIARFKGHALSLMDMGCGRGGDINKWVDAAFVRVLGIDPVDDNLTSPDPVNPGACSRAMTTRTRVTHGNNLARFPKIVFLRMDASRVINAEYVTELQDADPETTSIARALWALDNSATMPVELRSLHGFAAQGFDLVSCMFAVHYFFDTMQRLRAFATNVSNQLRAGGHFFGTCLDGDRVTQALSGVATGMSVEGRKDGRLLWNIIKLYEDPANKVPPKVPPKGLKVKSEEIGEEAPKKRRNNKKMVGGDDVQINDVNVDEERIGRRIRVFVESIGQAMDEYLVDFTLLKEVMAEKGLHPMPPAEAAKLGFKASDGFFDDLYSAMSTSDTQNQNVQVAMQMSDAEKEYSFMHRWFVFTKR
ncbi:putative mRNA-capping enzyme [Tetrabaena socialis]|uniref:Putative mRNA-capping enzyme n=1 Tax=Tetrabaena socialis TaxID=47790 RepID=A0A2J8AJA9_9CHLO|nr:putative mRNA-capping enzyme [Tetrabaena socialis]|eukprot:PNH12599.1 putative mRNA-capping enzyme [Tetrabaena socialis]